MYIDHFINDKYIALLCYRININKRNSIIVDFKYGIRNKTLLLYQFGKKSNYNVAQLSKFLSKLDGSNRIVFNTKFSILKYRNKLKKRFLFFCKYVNKAKIFSVYKKKIKSKFIAQLNEKFKKKQIKVLRRAKTLFKSSYNYNFLNLNTNLNKRFKKFKLLRFIIHKLLHNQVLGNVSLLGSVLDLELHPLFLRRFKYHFLLDAGIDNIRRIWRKRFNLNNFYLFFSIKFFSEVLKIGRYFLSLSGLKSKNSFYYSLYLKTFKEFKNLLVFRVYVEHLKKFKNYMSNSVNINYINVSFKFKVAWYSPYRRWRKVRRYFRKFKRINFFIFFNLAFLKLVVFLFLYWFNNFIILNKIINKSTISSRWFKSIGFIFKKYIWRKKPRNYYLSFNTINSLIFLNYRNRLIKY